MNIRAIALALAAASTAASAGAANLVTNGNFEQLNANAATGLYHICDNTQSECASILTGWTATASSLGPLGTNTPGSVLLGGNGGAEFNSGIGLYGPIPNSPAGGNFIGIDGDPVFNQSISQTINGLTIGGRYAVSFYQSAGQQIGLTGPTTEQWEVVFGGVSQFSDNQFNASESFLPWSFQRLVFTASSASQVLTFIGHGTPDGAPPVALLDGVSLNAVPEASTWAMLIAGFGIVGAAARRRRTTVAA